MKLKDRAHRRMVAEGFEYTSGGYFRPREELVEAVNFFNSRSGMTVGLLVVAPLFLGGRLATGISVPTDYSYVDASGRLAFPPAKEDDVYRRWDARTTVAHEAVVCPVLERLKDISNPHTMLEAISRVAAEGRILMPGFAGDDENNLCPTGWSQSRLFDAAIYSLLLRDFVGAQEFMSRIEKPLHSSDVIRMAILDAIESAFVPGAREVEALMRHLRSQ